MHNRICFPEIISLSNFYHHWFYISNTIPPVLQSNMNKYKFGILRNELILFILYIEFIPLYFLF